MEWSSNRTPLSVRLGASVAAVFASLAMAGEAVAAVDQAQRITELRPGPFGSTPQGFEAMGRELVFRAAGAGVGDEPWITDGTAAGTRPLEVSPGPGDSIPGDFTFIGDEVVFLAIGPDGDELWRTDGSQAGTRQVRDINPGPASSNPRSLLAVGDEAVFQADDGSSGTEPWRTDGTLSGTTRVADVNPGPGGGVGGFFFPARLGNHVVFEGSEPVAGSELWRIPVGGNGAELVANINLGGSSDPIQFTPVGSNVFFLADDGIVGQELWRSDGLPGGDYQLVDDFNNAATDSGIGGLEAFGSHVYVPVNGADGNGVELWRADAGGTQLVADINPAGNSSPSHLTPAGDWLYFTASDGANGREFWRTDGVPGGTTEMVANINPGGSSPCASPDITPVGDEVFFCANDGTTGNELWRSDGTPAGTSRVADINPGNASSFASALTAHGDTLYFSADDGTGSEPWALDTGRPETALESGPSSGSRTADRTPALSLSSGAIDLARFECSPSGDEGTFTACAGLDGEAEFPRLADGQHLLAIRAVDVRDNADLTPVQVPLTVDGTAPKVVVKGKVKASGKKAKATLLCKRSERSGPCRGKVLLRSTKGKAALGQGRFKLKPGKKKRVKVKLKARGRALVASRGAVKVKVAGRARDALGNSRKLRCRTKLTGP